jgi:hypothetical protein
MTTPNARLKILKMIEEGKISVEEGTRLLAALGKQKRKQSVVQEGESRWLRVRVTDLQSGKEEIRVNLPIGLIDVGLRMGARFVPDIEQELAIEELAEALHEGMTGKIIDIVNEEDGQRVELFIE